MTQVDLSRYKKDPNLHGRGILAVACWQIIQFLFVSSFQPSSSVRIFFLRLFGASIGTGVVAKPYVRVKYPWRLRVGDYSWIGESVWIDNMDNVTIGNHCCISQGAYICTGNHNWKRPAFDLVTRPVVMGDYSWLCAKAIIAPGVNVAMGSVITMNSVAVSDTDEWTIYTGNPARAVRKREIVDRK